MLLTLFLYSIFTTLDKILQIEDVTDNLEARPKKELRSSLPPSSISNQMEDTGISVWRIIYVANEWNEIQTYRKTSCLITIACVLILMQVNEALRMK